LKIAQRELVRAGRERERAARFGSGLPAVAIDDHVVVDFEHAAVVRAQLETIDSIGWHQQPAAECETEPFGTRVIRNTDLHRAVFACRPNAIERAGHQHFLLEVIALQSGFQRGRFDRRRCVQRRVAEFCAAHGTGAPIREKQARGDGRTRMRQRNRDRFFIARRVGIGRVAVERVADRRARKRRFERERGARIQARDIVESVHFGQTVMHAESIERGVLRREPALEIRPVAARARRPCDFGECELARKRHVFHALRRRQIFAPQIGLRAEDVMCLVRRQIRRQRIEAINLLERQAAAGHAQGFALGIAGTMIEIGVARIHDHVVPLLRGRDAALHAAPRHHGRARRQAAFENFIPADQLALVLIEKRFDAAQKITLHCMFVLHAFALHQILHEGAFLPAPGRRLVAAEMDIAAGEQRDHFAQYAFEKLERRFVRAEHVVFDAPDSRDFERAGRTGEFRVCRERRLGMSRHFDLRQDRHLPLRGVGDDFAHLRLRVETAVRLAIAEVWIEVASEDRLLAERADLGQQRIPLDLDAPTLVLGQMPVKGVEFVARHQIDVALDACRDT